MQELLTGLATLAAAVSNVAHPAPAPAPLPPPAAAPSPRPTDPSVDMELDSPATPTSPESPRSPDPEDGDDLFEPPRPAAGSGAVSPGAGADSPLAGRSRFDDLFGAEPSRVVSKVGSQRQKHGKKHREVSLKRGERR